MPTFVPSSFSSTMSDGSASKSSDSSCARCLSSSVPFEPKRWGVRGNLMKSSRVVPIDGRYLHHSEGKGEQREGFEPQNHCPESAGYPTLWEMPQFEFNFEWDPRKAAASARKHGVSF